MKVPLSLQGSNEREHTDSLAGSVSLEILGEFAVSSTGEGDMSRGSIIIAGLAAGRDWGCGGDGGQSGDERDDEKLHFVWEGGIGRVLCLVVSLLFCLIVDAMLCRSDCNSGDL